jgi:hypothetical protein
MKLVGGRCVAIRSANGPNGHQLGTIPYTYRLLGIDAGAL